MLTLISETSSHHIRRLMWWILPHHMVRHIVSNLNVVLFNHCDASGAAKMLLSHWLAVILLGLNYVTSEHLRIFYFNLWIVENIIIVVDILYYFNWLVSFLFLWLRGPTSSCMWSMHGASDRFGWTKVLLHWIRKVLLKARQISPLDLLITHCSVRQRVIRRRILLLYDIILIFSYAIFLLVLLLILVLLVNYLSIVVYFVVFEAFRLEIFGTAITRLIEIKLLFLRFLSLLVFIIGFEIPIGVPSLVGFARLHRVI